MRIKVLDSIKSADKNKLKEKFSTDILQGFSKKQKFISSKYFYDDKGSELFTEITKLDEYYLTNCEKNVFLENKKDISHFLKGKKFNLIELGAGDGQKTNILLQEFVDQGFDFNYLPIDISEGACKDLAKKVENSFPSLEFKAIVGEYLDGIDWIDSNYEANKVVLFLGSTIGNFDRTQALVFLRVLWKHLNSGDHLLIGFDLKKEISIMTKAYNDSKGITRDFNLNVLERINRELGGDFNLNKFSHHGIYNPIRGAMESYLISLEKQSVYIKDVEKNFEFDEYEPVHLEFSYKYLLSDIEYLAKETGYKILKNFSDTRGYFVDSLWQVVKE